MPREHIHVYDTRYHAVAFTPKRSVPAGILSSCRARLARFWMALRPESAVATNLSDWAAAGFVDGNL